MGERKTAMLWRGGNPFSRERKGREGLRECGVSTRNLSDHKIGSWGHRVHRFFANSVAQALSFCRCTNFVGELL